MPRYDVYEISGSNELFLDLQSNALDHLAVRVGAPLVEKQFYPKLASRLHQEFLIGDKNYVLLKQYMTSLPVSELKHPVGNLSSEHYRISSALDMLFYGF